ncbi:hypothetical protein APS14_24225 [Pseudomonas thivervalensis]|nr:hypothetical protein APS14_24225 [Pseudomonas thivervalensis]
MYGTCGGGPTRQADGSGFEYGYRVCSFFLQAGKSGIIRWGGGSAGGVCSWGFLREWLDEAWLGLLLWRGSLLPLDSVGAGEACDLLILIFCSRLNCQWKDRSLVALVSSYGAAQREQAPSPRGTE